MDKRKPTSALDAAQRRRGYVHFDLPLSKRACKRLVEDPNSVASHSFFPFLRQDIVRNRIRRVGPGQLEKTKKVRDIRYAAHADAAIYTYYNYLLSEKYEGEVSAAGLSDAVIAFRSLAKSNVDLANDAFQWIAAHTPCTALGFDVQDFFGSLDHRLLKKQWTELLSTPNLPPDHFSIYRSLTRHASVELIAARRALKLSREALRRADRLCSPLAFRQVIRGQGLVAVNHEKKGIPQGSPMSALLSNMYMLPFDQCLLRETASRKGLYRRYCDDILVVVAPEHATEMQAVVSAELLKLKLTMQTKKTLVCNFAPKADKALQYLGLVYDGANIFLRSSGIARYYARMRNGIGQHKASHRRDGATPILEQRRKHLIRQYTEHAPKDHRNYFSYVKSAATKTGSKTIRRQLRHHKRRFKDLMQE
ncbi:antiviral reverse transcriptase Drt2 [Stenotrophomonas sp. TWI587]|uniref:antiviral reverse transcriptase Drt2 n=1 Tax=Stenotrophomonas sp. TWI587 TaxID=3136783 RepID=UPI00320AAF2D